MSRHSASPWHTLTVYYDGDELTREVEHPAECPPQTHEEYPRCWFEGSFFEHPPGSDEIPSEPGVYRARVWLENLAAQGWPPDFTGGNEFELVASEETENTRDE